MGAEVIERPPLEFRRIDGSRAERLIARKSVIAALAACSGLAIASEREETSFI